MTSSPTTHPAQRTRLIIFILMVFAVLTAIVFFLPQSLRLDESQTLWQVNRFPTEILHAIGSDVHVPLYHYLLYIWEIFFGNGVVVNRIFSLIFFVASIPMVVLLSKETYRSKTVGLFAAALLATSPFMNWYGSEVRMYSLLVFLTLINQYFFIRWRKTGSRSMWWAYTISAIIGSYTHYFFGLVLVGQAVFLLFYRRTFAVESPVKQLALSFVIVAATLAPWVAYVFVLGQAVNSTPLLPVPSIIDIFNTFSEFLVGEQSVPINAFVVALWPLIMIAWFLTFQKKGPHGPDHDYLIFSLFIPIGITFGVSVLYKPVYLERYLIFTLPAFYLLLSAIIDAYPEKLANALRTAFIVASLVMIFVLAENAATPVHENYAVAASYFQKYATPQDVIAISAPFTIYPIEYYYQGPTAMYTIPAWDQSAIGPIPAFSSSTLPQQVQEIAGDHARLWLLLSYNQGYQQTIQDYFDAHYQRLDEWTLSPDMVLELYQLRYDVNVNSTTAITVMPMPGSNL